MKDGSSPYSPPTYLSYTQGSKSVKNKLFDE